MLRVVISGNRALSPATLSRLGSTSTRERVEAASKEHETATDSEAYVKAARNETKEKLNTMTNAIKDDLRAEQKIGEKMTRMGQQLKNAAQDASEKLSSLFNQQKKVQQQQRRP